MTIEERHSTVQTDQAITPGPEAEPGATPYPSDPAIQSRETVSRRSFTVQASNSELTRRVVVFVLGLIQAVIVLRIVILLVDARTGNALVAGILNVSQVFVAPFEGILHTNALSAGGSTFDLAAVVAIVGWTLVEFGVFAVINLFRRESAYGSPAS